MKIKRYGIYVCLLLVCIIGLSIGVCVSFADVGKPLSDEEMSCVYGGCYTQKCDRFLPDNCEAAATIQCQKSECTEPGWTGYVCTQGDGQQICETTNCRQTQENCQDGSPTSNHCNNEPHTQCAGFQTITKCQNEWDEETKTVDCKCTKVLAPTQCGGYKHWCSLSS